MTYRLSAGDLEGALAFVREALDEPGGDPFPPRVISLLRDLIGSDWATYCEIDHERREVRPLVEVPAADPALPLDLFWRTIDQHPLCQAHTHGRYDALKLSDFYSRRELHRLEIYAEWFREVLIEDELDAALPSPPNRVRTFLFDNTRQEFGERERALVNLLLPHLEQLHRAAAVRRVAEAARVALADSAGPGGQAVVVIDAEGRIDAASDHARRLLGRYFGNAAGARLPPALFEWLEQQRVAVRAGRVPAPFRRPGPASALVVDLDPRPGFEILVLTERLDGAVAPVALTAREREVLALVSEGMRNAEIAEALWVSPGTVRKHLENIYEKLGVHTRTAAVARAKGIAQAM